MARVTLYGKPGCHLCDEARAVVDAVRAERPFELEEVDVSLDPELHHRYGQRIPVVAVEGEEVCELGLNPGAVRDRLGRVAP